LKSPEKNRSRRRGECTILGIDPGSIHCGYGIVKTGGTSIRSKDRSSVSDCIYVVSGRISLPQKTLLHLRLKKMYDALVEIIRIYRPQEVIVERMFFAKSVRAALSLGHARGIALLAAAAEDITVYEYSALTVKKAVTGYGHAGKAQVQDMVSRILNIDTKKANLSEDSADALALALCHINTIQLKEALAR
jgi:crossover junction endodeoxyribonuclease RuvC